MSLLSSCSVDADDVAVHKAGVGGGGQKREGSESTRGCGREFMMLGHLKRAALGIASESHRTWPGNHTRLEETFTVCLR